jgi:hypothetical protein
MGVAESVATAEGDRPSRHAQREKALLGRTFACAEEDSNLHPVIPDQALNLVTRVSDMSV